MQTWSNKKNTCLNNSSKTANLLLRITQTVLAEPNSIRKNNYREIVKIKIVKKGPKSTLLSFSQNLLYEIYQILCFKSKEL